MLAYWSATRNRAARWFGVKPRITFAVGVLIAWADALSLAHASMPATVLSALLVSAFSWFVDCRRFALAGPLLILLVYCYVQWRVPDGGGLNLAPPGTLLRVRVEDVRDSPTANGRGLILISVLQQQPPDRRLAEPGSVRLGFANLVGQRGVLRANNQWLPDLSKGTVASMLISMRKPSSAAFPWQYDERRQVQRLGATFSGYVTAEPQIIARMDANRAPQVVLDAIVAEARNRMVSAHRASLGRREGDLLSSMVIGDKAVPPDETTKSDFCALGLTHLIAASGFNLTIVTAVAWWTGRLLARSSAFINLWSFAWIVVYSLIAGLSPSVERAALMCTIVLICVSSKRCAYFPSVIAVAATITLLIDPLSLADVGFQLSYGATIAIACGVNKLHCLLCRRWKLPVFLMELLAAAWIAMAATIPLQLYYFWQYGELSLLANMLVAPLVPLITILGFISSAIASAGTGWMVAIATFMDAVTRLPLSLMLFVVQALAANRWSVINTGPPCCWAMVCYYLTFTLLLFSLPRLLQQPVSKWCPVFVVTYVLSVIFLFWRSPLSAPVCVVCPDAVVLVCPRGQCLVIGNADSISAGRAVACLAVRNPVFCQAPSLSFGRPAVWRISAGAAHRAYRFGQLF